MEICRCSCFLPVSLLSSFFVIILFLTRSGKNSTSDYESTSQQINSTEKLTTSEFDPTDALVTFIVGGNDAGAHEFPWLVHFTVDKAKKTEFCGASIIDLIDLLLTAAHCVSSRNIKSIKVVAGDHDLRHPSGNEQVIIVEDKSAIRLHNHYDPNDENGYPNDIALIRLPKKLKWTNAVSPISLPHANSEFTGNAIVAGWGTNGYRNRKKQDVLQKVEVLIVFNEDCTSQINTSLQFCAGRHNKDACAGDSGSPLICNSMYRTICGIVSWGKHCGRYPGVYTKVSAYVDWINDNRNFTSSASLIIKPELLIILSLSSFVLYR